MTSSPSLKTATALSGSITSSISIKLISKLKFSLERLLDAMDAVGKLFNTKTSYSLFCSTSMPSTD